MEHYGIKGLFPNIDFQPEGPELSMMEMKKLQEDHFSAIKSSDAIYVINPEGYIGTMVTAETGKIELDALASGIISLDKLQELGKT